jgi:glycine/D-amino acid oxidase-like deaminating enzyme
MSSSADVAVVGGGIVGCAVAAFLAEAGASVLLVERDTIAAGASGRNSGIVQHPMDPVLISLFTETVAHYRDLAAYGFALPAEPQGLLLLAEEEEALAGDLAAIRGGYPELGAEALGPGEPTMIEPVLARHVSGVRLHTGYAVPPAAAAAAFAARAAAAGAEIRTGTAAALAPGGLAVDGAHLPAGAVVVAAGPWTPEVIDPSGAWRPIVPMWGVNAEVRLPAPPRHGLEEVGVEDLVSSPADHQPLFSLVTAGDTSSLGSTFLPGEPDAAAVAPALHKRGARFVPALTGAPIRSVRACARPQSADGRPLLGRAPGREGVFVAAGHGPWGISLGPASARLVADLVLGREPALSRAFDPARFA